jgi:hypothetical protein
MDDTDTHAGRRLRRIALLCSGLMLAVVVASAFLRHQQASAVLQAQWAVELSWARVLHRAAATLVLLGSVAMALLARRAGDRAALRASLALLGIALLLSVLGIVAGASRAAPVVLINLVGGFAMLALCVQLATPGGLRVAGGAARALLWLAALQSAAGAWASATAPRACAALVGCTGVTTVHRGGGVLLALALAALGAHAAWRAQRASGAALALVAGGVLTVGAIAGALGALSLLVVAHGALAAAAIALAARLALRGRPA